jgi:hypothetical protein
LLRPRRERPRGRRAAEERDELPSLQLIEVHPIPHRGGTVFRKNIEAAGISQRVSRTFCERSAGPMSALGHKQTSRRS